MSLKHTILFSLMAALLVMGGCATVEREEFIALQSQVYRNQTELRNLSKKLEQSRRPQAAMTAEMNTMTREIARLRGQIEETGHQINSLPNPQVIADVERKVTANQEELLARIEKLEKYLGVTKGAKSSGVASAKKPTPVKQPVQASLPETAQAYYDLGRRLFKQKSYQAARDRFNALLKKFPKSKLAPSSHYWIGESYYNEKKFEEAILAYNQIVKRYSKSSKASSALLKQGLSFSALGDKRTAKIVLKKLIKKYPKTSQAKLAKKILSRMK